MEDVTQQNPMGNIIGTIRQGLSPAAIFEQLAEECAELSKCALKQARIIRGENPTPLDLVDVVKETDEEVTDVLVCLEVLGLKPNDPLMVAKMQRWAGRIMAVNQTQRDEPEPDSPDIGTPTSEVIE